MAPPVALRKYPYPYRGALAICSDLDFITPEDFLQIHRFLNTAQVTPMGAGVGLEIADSFWMYSAQPAASPCFSYFAGLEPVESPWAGMIADFIRAGYIDCLHAYGDFSHYGGFRRPMAARAVEVLQDQGIRIPVWTNHGDRHNFQNLGESYSLGDRERSQSANGDWFPSAEYHADLTRALGVKFVWRSADLTQVWGQDRPLGSSDVLTWERLRHPRTHARWLGRQLRGGWGRDGANALLKPAQLRDGSSLIAFARYGRFSQDRADDLEHLLSESHLRRLIRDETVTVLYTHLGKRLHRDGPPVPHGAQAGLRRLARASGEGLIFVTTTSRLLAYCHARDQVRYTVRETADALPILIEPAMEPQELAGMTWYVDSSKPVRVYVGEQALDTRANPADHTGRASVSVRWTPLDPRRLDRYFHATDV
jgi:hypothetical protein